MSEPITPIVRARDATVVRTPFADILWHCHAGNSALSDLSLGTATFPTGGGHGPHRHPNAEEFIYVLTGKARQGVEDETFNMAAGDCAHIPKDAVHSTQNVGDTKLVILVGFSASDPETADIESE